MSIRALTVLCLILACPLLAGDIVVEDVHGRPLNGRAVTLVDWDGFMANPAIKLRVRAPLTVSFPALVEVRSTEPRLYFDLPSSFGASGPTRYLSIEDPNVPAELFISIFPDRDGEDETHTLEITIDHLTVTLDVHVIDQDLNLPHLFDVTVNFGQDETGFFSDALKRTVVQQAVDDWTYFIGDMDLDTVAVGAERTLIWDSDGFNDPRNVTNAAAYTGFLLYAYGIHHAELRSGGEPSTWAFQRSNGSTLPLRRSGGVEIETMGNYNTLGWLVSTSESDWWDATNYGDEQADLYSIVHHEAGHALFFNPGYSNFDRSGTLTSSKIVAYHGSALTIDAYDHFDAIVDRSSQAGAFGAEYYGSVARGRWLPTKLDLLALEAVGYELRALPAFSTPVITTPISGTGSAGNAFELALTANGGTPAYDWTLAAGALPPGLTLDRFSGLISGTPTQSGTFSFTVRVRDSDVLLNTATAAGSITITAPPLAAPSGVSAQAIAATTVRVSWNAVAGAAEYEVFRRAAGGAFVSRGRTSATTLDDPAAASTAYLYQVRALTAGGVSGAASASDLATTVLFTDDPISAGATNVKAIHLTQLRAAVNAVRALAGSGAATFTASTIIKAVQVTELRGALAAARATLGLSTPSFTDPTLGAGTSIKAVHFIELRNGVK